MLKPMITVFLEADVDVKTHLVQTFPGAVCVAIQDREIGCTRLTLHLDVADGGLVAAERLIEALQSAIGHMRAAQTAATEARDDGAWDAANEQIMRDQQAVSPIHEGAVR